MFIVFNKPFQVLSHFTDENNRSNLSDFIDIKNVYSVGRLDYDSEGLMLLTDDGKLKHRLSHPKNKVNKVYLTQVEGRITAKALQQLRNGIILKDGFAKVVEAQVLARKPGFLWKRDPPIRYRKNDITSWVELTINEGRNRQVRRMLAYVGFPVLRLIRTQIGKYHLKDLKPGSYQVIS